MKSSIIKSLMLGASVSLPLFSCNSGNGFVLEGSCAADVSDSVYLLYVSGDNLEFPDAALPVDTIRINASGKTFSWQTNQYQDLRLATLVPLSGNRQNRRNTVNFPLCPGEKLQLSIKGDYFEFDGSAFYHDWRALSDSLQAIQDKAAPIRERFDACMKEAEASIDPVTGEPDSVIYAELMKLNVQMIKFEELYQTMPSRYMKAHPDSDGDIALLGTTEYPLRDSLYMKSKKVLNGRIRKLVEKSIADQQKKLVDNYVRQMNLRKAADETREGMKFADFEAEYEGKHQKLSDYVGRGKYMLVCFWASWSNSCQEEIPTLNDVYSKYKSDKFDMLGVPSNDEALNALQTIHDANIAYPQILNAKDAGLLAYGITSIPSIILFAPDGTIVARALRGKKIEEAVKSALNK